MKKTILAAGAIVLLASVGFANAAEVTGRIKSLDEADHLVTLSNGQQYNLISDPGEPNLSSILDDFHVGERVQIIHNGSSASGITALN